MDARKSSIRFQAIHVPASRLRAAAAMQNRLAAACAARTMRAMRRLLLSIGLGMCIVLASAHAKGMTATSSGVMQDHGTGKTLPASTSKRTFRVPILMYHYIVDPHLTKNQLGARLSVSPAAFSAQL